MARDDVPRGDELEAHLGRLARTTDDLAVDPRVTDAVMARTSLETIARATEGLSPTPALTDAVMARVTRTRAPRSSQGAAIARDVERTGPWAVALAAVAAAAAVLVSLQAEQQLAGDLASSLEDAELVASLEGGP